MKKITLIALFLLITGAITVEGDDDSDDHDHDPFYHVLKDNGYHFLNPHGRRRREVLVEKAKSPKRKPTKPICFKLLIRTFAAYKFEEDEGRGCGCAK